MLLNSKLFQEALDVHHDQSKLLVTVNNFEIALVVSVVVHLSVGISVERHALFASVLLWGPPSWGALILVDVLSTTLVVQIVWSFFAIYQDKRQSLLKSLQRHHL